MKFLNEEDLPPEIREFMERMVGNSHYLRLELTVAEMQNGVEKEIPITRRDTCERCLGKGGEPGTPEAVICPKCHGARENRVVTETWVGSMVRVDKCVTCKGRGRLVQTPCQHCEGFGYLSHETTVQVHIPPNTDEDVEFKIKGVGDNFREPDGQRRDVTFFVKFPTPENSTREDDDFIHDLYLEAKQLKMGTVISVATLNNETIALTIPLNTRSGAMFRVKNEGFPIWDDDDKIITGRGDMLVYVYKKQVSLTERVGKLFRR